MVRYTLVLAVFAWSSVTAQGTSQAIAPAPPPAAELISEIKHNSSLAPKPQNPLGPGNNPAQIIRRVEKADQLDHAKAPPKALDDSEKASLMQGKKAIEKAEAQK